MRLIKIKMVGFMSFREETEIPLSDAGQFILIDGPNGVGKSTIFAGIEWVLFGATRNKSHDEMINDYDEYAKVELDVQDNEGTTWRIIREHWWQGSTKIEIQYIDQDGDWVRFSNHLKKDSERQIAQIVGMSIDAWHSLCMVSQGMMARGTAFTSATSDDRRGILISLLPELDVWSNYEQIAKARMSQTRDEMESAKTLLDEYNESLRIRLGNMRDVAVKVSSVTGKSIELEEVGLKTVRKDGVLGYKKAYKDISEAIASNTLDEKVENLEGQIAEMRSVINSETSGRQDIETRLQSLRNLRNQRNSDLKYRIKELKSGKRRVQEIQSDIEDLDTQAEFAESKIAEHKKRIADNKTAIDDLKGSLDDLQNRADAASDEMSKAQNKKSVLEGQLADLENRAEAQEIQLHSDGSATCILCDSDLSHERAVELADKTKKDLEAKRTEIDIAEDDISSARSANRRASNALKRAQNDIRDLETENASLTKDVSTLNDKVNSLEESLDKLESETLKEAEAELGMPVDEVLDEIASLEDQIEDSTDEEDQLSTKLDDLDAEHPLNSKIENLKKDIRDTRDKIALLNKYAGNSETEYRYIEEVAENIAQATRDLNDATERYKADEWTRWACSPKGVPSKLIKSVLENIEDRQNDMIRRLMGDRAFQVSFTQERELKSREGTKQVLDIEVHTITGFPRSYESFSGGEKIRLNISNLFAMIEVFNERNPGMIRSLFLDEPFGELDSDTWPVMIECINDAIRNGVVDQVFLMAHNDDIKDSIPDHVVVDRDRSDPKSSSSIELVSA